MLMVQSPYNVMKTDSASVSQGSLASLAMNALLDLKASNAINAHQNIMDTQIVKVSIVVRNYISNLTTSLNDMSCLSQNQPYLFISECQCNPDGSTTLECNNNGDCTCKDGYSGTKCDASSGTKVLVATGQPDASGKVTEIIDLEDESFKCNVKEFPLNVYSAIGGLVGTTPFICGGRSFSNVNQKSCYSLKEDGEWEKDATSELNTPRYFAANGVSIINNTMVVAGGNNNGDLATIEVVAPNTKSKTLPISLPHKIHGPCIVPWDTNTVMFMGGHSARKGTYFINLNNNTITNGPSLLAGRSHMACHEFSFNGEDYILVVGGDSKSTTELLKKSDLENGWQKSKNSKVLFLA